MANRLDQNRWELRLRDNFIRESKREALADQTRDQDVVYRFQPTESAADLEFENFFQFSSFDEIFAFFVVVRELFLHRDLTKPLRIKAPREAVRQNLRMLNTFLEGRAYDQIKGEFVIKKFGKFTMKTERIADLYQFMLSRRDNYENDLPFASDLLQEIISCNTNDTH